MAFTASTVWEVQTGGNDANGAGFDFGVSGFPTDGTVDANTGNTASPVFSSASYNFVAGDVGAWLLIKAGTNAIQGFYQIASVASNKATLSAGIGAASIFTINNLQGTGLIPNTAAGIATVGTPTSLTWGIDYSQQASPQITFTDMVIGGTTTQFTSAANPVGKNFVGNIINVTSGTGFTVQRVAIVSTSGTTATCDKSLGTASSTGGNGKLGGAALTPGYACGLISIASQWLAIKTGTYTITSASTNIAAGCLSNTTNGVLIFGYGTIRGDLLSPPTLIASGISTFTILANTATGGVGIVNLILDGASLTSSRGLANSGNTVRIYAVGAINCTNNGFAVTAGNPTLIKCYATGCSTQPAFTFAVISPCYGCAAYSNTITGFAVTAGTSVFVDCIAANNSGASSDGFSNAVGQTQYVNCTAYLNGRDGFRITAGNIAACINCIAEANVGTGFDYTVAGTGHSLINCATFNNGTAVTFTTPGNIVRLNDIVGTSTFFANAAGNDFSLNTSPTGGGLCRGAGFPATLTGITSTISNADVGAVQHRDGPIGQITGARSIGTY